MAEWQPPRANPNRATPPPAVDARLQNQLEEAIELATYCIYEECGSGEPLVFQENRVIKKVRDALPFIEESDIIRLTDQLHRVFIEKARKAVTVSGLPVPLRLLDPRDPFRLGANYEEATTPITPRSNPTVVRYADDTVLDFNSQ